jgi:hypothetical protein
MKRWASLLVIACALAAPLAPASSASARASAEYTYRYEQMWQATIRLLRVDLGCQITDRDDSIGYVMFEYPGTTGRMHTGSAELVRTTDGRGNEEVRVTIQIPTLPSYVERHVLTQLERKLHSDFGQPPRAPRVTRPAEPPAEDPPEGDAPSGDAETPDTTAD